MGIRGVWPAHHAVRPRLRSVVALAVVAFCVTGVALFA